MYCYNCGRDMGETAFCPHCGAARKAEGGITQAPAPPPAENEVLAAEAAFEAPAAAGVPERQKRPFQLEKKHIIVLCAAVVLLAIGVVAFAVTRPPSLNKIYRNAAERDKYTAVVEGFEYELGDGYITTSPQGQAIEIYVVAVTNVGEERRHLNSASTRYSGYADRNIRTREEPAACAIATREELGIGWVPTNVLFAEDRLLPGSLPGDTYYYFYVREHSPQEQYFTFGYNASTQEAFIQRTYVLKELEQGLSAEEILALYTAQSNLSEKPAAGNEFTAEELGALFLQDGRATGGAYDESICIVTGKLASVEQGVIIDLVVELEGLERYWEAGGRTLPVSFNFFGDDHMTGYYIEALQSGGYTIGQTVTLAGILHYSYMEEEDGEVSELAYFSDCRIVGA